MKNLILLLCACNSFAAMAATPEPVVKFTDAYQGYATVAGGLQNPSVSPVGVQIENGGIVYATVTDGAGRWAAVIRLRSSSFSVKTFDLKNAKDQSAVRTGTFEM